MTTTLERQINYWDKAHKPKHKPIFINLSNQCEIHFSSNDYTHSCLFCVLVIKYPTSSLVISSVNNNLYCTYSDAEGISIESYKADIILKPNKGKLYIKISATDDTQFSDVYLIPECPSEDVSITLFYQLNDSSSFYCSNLSESETYSEILLKDSNKRIFSSPYKLFCNLLSTIDYEVFKLHKANNFLKDEKRSITSDNEN